MTPCQRGPAISRAAIRRAATTRPATQRGAALVVSLMLLAIVMVLATAGWQMGTQQERMVGQQRDQAIAFEAAEATLRDGERDLLGTCGIGIAAGACTPRTDPINGETGFGNGGAVGTCSSLGLCLGDTAQRPDFDTRNVIAVLTGAPGGIGLPVVYGTYTRPGGATRAFNGPNGAALPWQPRYVIESLCYGGGGQGMTGSFVASCPSPIYRITAIARGVRQNTADGDQASEVILQSYYTLGN